MSWARIDDGFDDHPKVLALLECDDGAAAIGLWTLCLTWAHRNTRKKGKVPGFLPASLPRRYLGVLGRDAAKLLVEAGLWDAADGGWQIHDFGQYLPTAETSEARSAAGRKGAESRWAKHRETAGPDSKLPSGDGKPVASQMASDSKPMASDGSVMAGNAREAGAGPDDAGPAPPDGKLPFSDSNLPSDDGKPMASDGSRAGARRAIPNGIAPVPVPVVPPTAAESPLAATAQTLIAEWLDHCRKRPPQRVIGQVARELSALLGEGQAPGDVRAGLARWHQSGKHPSTLASFVNEVMNASPSRASPAAGRPSTTDRAVAEARAVRARIASRHQEQA